MTDILPNRSASPTLDTPSQLEMHSIIDTRNTFSLYDPWIGIWLHFADHPFIYFDPIFQIPAGTTAFVRVKGTRRRLLTDCIDKFKAPHPKFADVHPLLQQ